MPSYEKLKKCGSENCKFTATNECRCGGLHPDEVKGWAIPPKEKLTNHLRFVCDTCLQTKIPEKVECPYWNQLEEFVEKQLTTLASGGRSKDFNHYIFEIVMETMYGENFWDWWNENEFDTE